MLRFRINWDKAIEAIDLLARHKPGITQYYVGKICYFADKEHLLDYGRPITGDRYIAMEHGPVPSSIRDLLNGNSDFPDDIITSLYERVDIEKSKNLLHTTSKGAGDFKHLSGSDQEYLLTALRMYGNMNFPELRNVSHDAAWNEAWALPGISNEMNPQTWLSELAEEDDRAAAVEFLSSYRARAV